MNIFKKRKGRKRKKRRSTEEMQYRKAQFKTKIFLEKTAVEMASQDPALMRQWVAQTFGFTLPDPTEEHKRKLRAVIQELALRQMEKNPDIARKVADAKIFQTMRDEGLVREGPSAMERLTADMEAVKRLKEVMCPAPIE